VQRSTIRLAKLQVSTSRQVKRRGGSLKSPVGADFPIGKLKDLGVLQAESGEEPMSGRAPRSAATSEWYQSLERLFAFSSREEGNSPCHRGENDSHLIQRIERCRGEEAGR
jgi:hypothetical protein